MITRPSPRFSSRFFAIASIAIGSSLLASGTALAQYQVSGDGQGVAFSQEFFDFFDDGVSDISSTAAVTIDFDVLTAASGIAGGGYLNIVDGQGDWVVENVPVFPETTPLFANTSTYVDLSLAEGDDDTGVGTNQSVYYSAAPLTLAPANAPAHFGLTQDLIDPGGMEPDPGAAAFVEPGAFGPNLNGITKSKIKDGSLNVQAAVNQCAPAAAANGLKALSNAFNFVSVPSVNSDGRGQVTGGTYPNNGNVLVATHDGNGGEFASGEPSDSLVGEMDLAMPRNSANRKTFNNTNAPTPFQNQLNGILRYLGTHGNVGRVAVNYESVNNALLASLTLEGITANPVNGGKLDASTINYIYDELSKGSMVNLDYSVLRRGAAGGWINLYGHAVDIVGMEFVKDVPYILLSSDLDQTNTDLADSSLGKDDGLFWASINAVNFGNKPYLYLTGVPGADNRNTFAYISAIITVDAIPEPAAIGLLSFVGMIFLRRRRSVAA